MRTVKENATCSICGKPYYMCMSCKDQMELSPWKVFTDISEHYKIYQILHGVSVGVYTEKEAQEKLKNVDLSDLNTLLPNIKNRIDKILAFDSLHEKAVNNKSVNNAKEDDKTNKDVKDEKSNNANQNGKKFFRNK